MKRMIFLMVLTLVSSLAYAALSPLLGVRALLANSTFESAASPQAQTPRPIRELAGLEEIRIWLGGSGTNLSFGPNHPALSERLNLLDNFHFDMRPSGNPANPAFVDAYDIFYSNADGTLNTDGAYLTIEAVSSSMAQGAGGGNVAEVGLKVSSAATFEYGNTVASSLTLGGNADLSSLGKAIDGNTQTFTRLGNTDGQSQRLRITIGFQSSSGDVPCTYSIAPTVQTFPSDGGSGTFRVIAPNGCPWYISSLIAFVPQTTFVRLSSPREGSGNATLSYSVDPNITSFRRSATISIRETNDETAPAVKTFTVTQEPLSCPASAYSISPTDLVFDSGSSRQRVTVTSQVGCFWSADANADWIQVSVVGTNSVDIIVADNYDSWRGSSVSVAGKVIGVYQNSQHCSLEVFCQVFPAACGAPRSKMLSLSRSFRDNTLVKTSRGRAYTDTYYRFSPEAVQIMMLNPMMMLRSREIIERYKPVIESMVTGEQVTLTHGDLDEIVGFLDSFAAKGSPQFQQAIRGVCEDLRDPQVHAEFGITMTDGVKRELPTHPILQSAHGVGGSVVIGFGLTFVFFLARGRRKYFTPGARRVLCVMLAILLGGGQWSVARGQSKSRGQSSVVSGQSKNDAKRLPITFEANQGQADPAVRFISRGDGYSLFLAPTEAVMARARQRSKAKLQKWEQLKPATDHRPPTTDLLRMKLVGANSVARTTGLDELAGKTNYFIGKDSEGWRANVPTYARVKCEKVYPGVDMLYYGNERELEYDFKVAPGADPRTIKLKFDGAETINIDKDGDLVIRAASEVRMRKPVAYQDVNGSRQEIPSRYIIRNSQSAASNQEVGFGIAAYDTTKPLIIDPVLVYSTYLGGGGDDEGNGIAVDSSGNLYIVGFTDSVNFPTFSASQPAPGGGQQDVFVTKLNPSGTQLIYSTYLGGNRQDNGSSIAVDSAGNAYITGFTNSTNFPVQNAMQPAKNGPFNAFISKLDPTGALVYSTHLGGSAGDYSSSVAVDSAGNVYVAGVATSPNFPMVNAIQPTQGGSADVYIAKLNPTGSGLIYATYLGGAGDDGPTGIAVDPDGNVYITGMTSSPNFRTASPLQPTHRGGLFDAFVAKLNPSGTGLVYSTYLGGSGEDRGGRITVDSAGNAYLTGDTDSANFPTVGALQTSIGGSSDAFVAKINPSGSALVYSTYLGGSRIDGGTAIAVDSKGRAYVTGFTSSTDFPTSQPLQQANGGGSFDAFVSKLSPSGAALSYSTYLGGAGADAGFGIALGSRASAYVMGQTDSTNFPTASPLQPSNGGGTSDVFVAKISTSGPRIDSASISGKKLSVFGDGFDDGAKVLLDGESQKTANDEQNPTTALVSGKSGKKVALGQTVTLQVRNPDGTLSNQINFTR